MTRICITVVLLLFSVHVSAQCDSVVVTMAYQDGDYAIETTKTKLRYDSSGNMLAKEVFKSSEPDFVWRRKSLYIFLYDANNNLLNSTTQTGNDTGYVNQIRTLFAYNSSDSLTAQTSQTWTSNTWQTTSADSFWYDTQNRLINHSVYDLTPKNRTLHYHNSAGLDTTEVMQNWNVSLSWINYTRKDKYYDASQEKILDVNFSWNINAWDSASKVFWVYSNGLLDSQTIQVLDTSWKNSELQLFEYGPHDKLIHQYFLHWNDTGWIYDELIITEVDSNGYPSYQDNLGAYYSGGSLGWNSFSGPHYFNYNSSGQLLGTSGYNSPGGPFNSDYTYHNGIPIKYHLVTYSMGGLVNEYDRYYYYADILGDSILCTGESTVLYSDSCLGYTYQWSNGMTTPSINVTLPGTYSVMVTYPSGFIANSPPTNVTMVNGLPYIAQGPDSSITTCGNSYRWLIVPSQYQVSYQWYLNDTAISSVSSPSLILTSANIATGYYYLVATNGCGSDTSAKTYVTALPYPTAPVITPSPQAIMCAGDSMFLTSTSAVAYLWPHNNDTSQSVYVHNQGNYRVFVYNSAGCFAVGSTYIFDRPYPQLVYIYFQNGQVNSNASNAQWFFNGDSIPGATGNTITPILAGYYYVSGATYPPCYLLSDSIYLDPTTVNIQIPAVEDVCINGNVYIGDYNPVYGGTPPYHYQWSPATNLVNQGNGLALVSNISSNTTYYLTVTDSNGLVGTDSTQVIVHPPVTPQLTVTGNQCENKYHTVRIASNASNYDITKWIINGDTINSTSNYFDLPATGIYQAMVTDQYGCKLVTGPDTFLVYPAPARPLINLIPDSAACINGSGTLWVNQRPGENYAWYQSNTLIGTDTAIQVSLPVEYNFQLTDSNGCQTSNYFNFDLWTETMKFMLSSPYTLCDSDTVMLQAPLISGYSYTWFHDGINLNNNTNTVHTNLAGAYECVVTSPDGCTGSGLTYLTDNQPPTVSISLTNGVMASSAQSNVSYQWFFNGDAIAGAFNSTLIPVDTGNYYLRIKPWPGYGSQCYGYSNTIYYLTCTAGITLANNIVCTGMCDGELTAFSGSSSTATYLWSNGHTTSTINGLCTGTYDVVITDSTGCSATATAQVLEHHLAATLAITNASCTGCNDGSVMINVQQGSPPYTYSHQPASGNILGNIIQNLQAGIYQFCVTDSMQCSICITDTIHDLSVTIMETSDQVLAYYPNPVSTQISIIGLPAPTIPIYTARIIDDKGNLMLSRPYNSALFDVSFLTPGIYLLELKSEEQVFRLRFVKISP